MNADLDQTLAYMVTIRGTHSNLLNFSFLSYYGAHPTKGSKQL